MQKLVLSSAVLLLVVVSFAACHKKNKTSDTTMPPLHIEVAAATLDSVSMRYSFVSHLSSNYNAIIQPRVNGYLKKINFASGMPVKKGDLLFVIDDDLLLTTLRAAQADLASAQAQEIEARNNYERAIPLASINAISQSQLDQYTAQYTSARSSVLAAKQSLENARLQVSYAKIYSPIDGIIAQTPAHEGDYVGPSTKFTSLTTISNFDTLSAYIAVPTSLYMKYSDKDSASYNNANLLSDIELFLADESLYPYRGTYNYTQQTISTSSGTITLVVNFPNPQSALKSGEYAKVETNMGQRMPKILVPQQCVNQIQGLSYVWIIRPDSTAEYRQVTAGETYGDKWIIEKGVQQGEHVALTGSMKLHNKQKVMPYTK